MPNGAEEEARTSRLAESWRAFDVETKLNLLINEVDRLHDRDGAVWRDLNRTMNESRNDVTQRVQSLRDDVAGQLSKIEVRQTRSLAFLYTIIGGVVVGLVLLVVQLASQ